MGSDMVVALQEASANRTTLFGVNHHASASERHALHLGHGQGHDSDELSPLGRLQIPEVRQTCAVLGIQPLGQWGYTHGVNEHCVAVGVTDWQSRLGNGEATLSGADLTRLVLERSHSAHHAVEVLTDLLEHYGQATPDGTSDDHIYLIADASEAYVLETCGRYWALLECGHTRVVTDAAMIRQDWRRLAPGLSNFVVEKGWCQDDGSKIDFVRSLGESSARSKNAQKRWGRASLALSQQQGAIDVHFLRRMLAEHYVTNRELLPGDQTTTLATSFLVDLHKTDASPLVWVAFGTPKVAVYFPISLAGELPAAFGAGQPDAPTIQQRTLDLRMLAAGKDEDRNKLEAALERLQTRFDQDAEDFLVKTHQLAAPHQATLLAELASEMMRHHVDLFDKEYRRLFGLEETAPHGVPAEEEEVLFFA